MKILVDVGNTNTSIAFSERGRILKKFFIKSAKKEVAPRALKRLLGEGISKASEIVVVQVVPGFFEMLRKNLEKVAGGVPLRLVGRDITVPMDINYRDPSEVGQDRLVTAYGGFRVYGAPLIMIDFGTAVTFDFVGPGGSYEGGFIFPGLRIALEALSSKAALLPRIQLSPTGEIPGKDTENSMNSGVLYGFSGACDGIIEKLKAGISPVPKVIATGGDASLIAGHTGQIDGVHPDIVFESLDILSGADRP